jgi:ATP-dependent RNA helicase DeaD
MTDQAQHPALARALSERGYTELTPVQAAVLQAGAEARDLLVSAQTGSGKTVAYGLAFAGSLLGGEEKFGLAGAPLALVIAPTRELAMQVHRELSWLYAHTGARIVACIGGMDAQREARALQAGCHIVVGTPGRLCDHFGRGRLVLGELRVVVLDEADEMLDLGFREELDTLLDATPDWRRMLLFSATIAKDILGLARAYQKDALRIDTLVRNQPHADIEYQAIRTPPRETEHAVVNILRYYEAPTALVFCATREGVKHLHASLLERGFTSVALSGELSQAERTRALQAMRDGQARVCVATDVAARGLDLPELSLVIHADLPTNKQILLHRSGRTGRAGRKGISVLVVPASRVRAAEGLIHAAGVSAVWGEPPMAEEVFARDGERLLADPCFSEETTEEDAALGRALLQGRSAEDVASALVRLYRARLPAPEEIAPLPPAGAARRVQEKPAHDGGAATVWFSLNVGRAQKADPKWLLPLICRMGGVEKREIGAIRIQDRETRFEIVAASADDFMARLPNEAGGMRIARSEAPDAGARRDGFVPRHRFKAGGAKAGDAKLGTAKPARPMPQARRRKGKPST